MLARLFIALIAALAFAGACGAQDATAATEEARYDQLFADLLAAPTQDEAAFIAEEIEALWGASGSDTADLLMERAVEAAEFDRLVLARELADGALEIAPDYADGWAESALIALYENEVTRALEDISRAVDLEPRHYDALFGLGVVLEQMEAWAGAYEAYQRALAIYPLHDGAQSRAHEIEPRARGRDL